MCDIEHSVVDIDPFEILGISPDSDRDIIDGAYLSLMTENHPDKTRDLDEKEIRLKRTQEIVNAYALLSDDNAIRAYREKITVGDYASLRNTDRNIDQTRPPDSSIIDANDNFNRDAFNEQFMSLNASKDFIDLQSRISNKDLYREYDRYVLSRDTDVEIPFNSNIVDSQGKLSLAEFNKYFEDQLNMETNEIQETGRIGSLFGGESSICELDYQQSFEPTDISKIVSDPVLPGIVDNDRATRNIEDMLKSLQAERSVNTSPCVSGGVMDPTIDTSVFLPDVFML